MKLIENSAVVEKLQVSLEADLGKIMSCEIVQVNGIEKSAEEKVETKLQNGVTKSDEKMCNGYTNKFCEDTEETLEDNYQLVLESSSEDDGSPTKKQDEDSKYDVVQEIEDLLGLNSTSEDIDKELDGAESIELNEKEEDDLINGESQEKNTQVVEEIPEDEAIGDGTENKTIETVSDSGENVGTSETNEESTLEENEKSGKKEKDGDLPTKMDIVVDEVDNQGASTLTAVKQKDDEILSVDSDLLKVTSSDEKDAGTQEMQDSSETQHLDQVKEDIVGNSQDEKVDSEIAPSLTTNCPESFSDCTVLNSVGASEDESNQNSSQGTGLNIFESENEKDCVAKTEESFVTRNEGANLDDIETKNEELSVVEAEDSEESKLNETDGGRSNNTEIDLKKEEPGERSYNTEEDLKEEEPKREVECDSLSEKDSIRKDNKNIVENTEDEKTDDDKKTAYEEILGSESEESLKKEVKFEENIENVKSEINNITIHELVQSENDNMSTLSCSHISVEGPRKRTASEEDVTPNKKPKIEEEEGCKIESSPLKRPCLDPIGNETKRLRAADSTFETPREEMDTSKLPEDDTKADKEDEVADNTNLSPEKDPESREMQCTEINSVSATVITLDEPTKHSSDEVSTSDHPSDPCKNINSDCINLASNVESKEFSEDLSHDDEGKDNVEVSSTDTTADITILEEEKELKSKPGIEQESDCHETVALVEDTPISNNMECTFSKTLKEAIQISSNSNDVPNNMIEEHDHQPIKDAAKDKIGKEAELDELSSSSTTPKNLNSFPLNKIVEAEKLDSLAKSLPSTKSTGCLSLNKVENSKLDTVIPPPILDSNTQNNSLTSEAMDKSKLNDSVIVPSSSDSQNHLPIKTETEKPPVETRSTPLAEKSTNLPQKAAILPLLKKFRKSELQKLTKRELEEAVVLKICEAITDRSEIGQLRQRCHALEQNNELWRKKATQFEKQSRELEMVLKRYMSETAQMKRDGVIKAALPIKVTRSVGLQVVLASSMHGALVSSKSRLSESDQFKHSIHQQQRPQQHQQPERQQQQQQPQPQRQQQQQPERQQHQPQPQPQRQQQQQPPKQQTTTTTTTTTSSGRPRRSETEASRENVKTAMFTPPAVQTPPTRRPVGRPPKNSYVVGPSPPPVKIAPQPSPSKSTPPSTPTPTPTPVKTPQKVAQSPSKDLEVIDLTDKEERVKTAPSPSPSGGGIRVNPSTQVCYVQQNTSSSPPQQMAYLVQKPGQRQYLVTTTSATPTRPVTSRPPPGLALPVQFRGAGHVVPMQQASPVVTPRSTPAPSTPRSSPSPIRVQSPLLKHPAPLPPAPLSVAPQKSGLFMKGSPPKPQLKIAKTVNGIMLSWSMSITKDLADIGSYQLYAYQEGLAQPSTSLWKKVGDVKALPLPMACTLTQFIEGHKYHFAVRAVDVHGRIGPFSQPSSILLTN